MGGTARANLHREYYVLSDDIDDEEIARISVFCRAAEIDFQHLAGPRNVSVKLKYDVLCLRVFVYGIPA